MLITVAELPEYAKRANQLLKENEQEKLVAYLAENPSSGNLIQGTGGVRKLRWAHGGKGKSGGVRVIHYYYNDNFPLFLLGIFSKSEKENMTKAERNNLGKIVEVLKTSFKS